MKTETLIELQRSITQGKWSVFNSHEAGSKTVWQPNDDEPQHRKFICDVPASDAVDSDAAAIALVPELIAEVIRLREALSNALNVMAGVATGDLKTIKPDSNAIAIARAALANDK